MGDPILPRTSVAAVALKVIEVPEAARLTMVRERFA
jgi:hypothetical protein